MIPEIRNVSSLFFQILQFLFHFLLEIFLLLSAFVFLGVLCGLNKLQIDSFLQTFSLINAELINPNNFICIKDEL